MRKLSLIMVLFISLFEMVYSQGVFFDFNKYMPVVNFNECAGANRPAYVRQNQNIVVDFPTHLDWTGDCQDNYYLLANCYQGFSNINGFRHIGLCNGLNGLRVSLNIGDVCVGNNSINVRRDEIERTYDFLGFEKDCEHKRSSYSTAYNFCVLPPANTQLGDITADVSSNANDPNRLDKMWFYFYAGPNFCPDGIQQMQFRLDKFNGDPVTGSEADWGPWQQLYTVGNILNPDPRRTIGIDIVFSRGYGEYVFKAKVKDALGGEYLEQNVVVCYKPKCVNDAAPTVSLLNATTVDGGYPNGSTTGGYLLNQGETYDLKLYNGTQITNFDQYYTVYARDGENNPVPGSDLVLTKTATGRYNLTLNVPKGSYTIYVNNDPQIVSPLGTSCTYSCQRYLNPINVMVGGQNLTATGTSACVIYLPRDFQELFGFSPTSFALTHFTYTVVSDKAIVLQPGQTGIRLQAGARLLLNTTTSGNSAELADNNKNWSQQWVYDESGKVIAESKSFYDQTGRIIQSQAKNLSAGVVLATQVMNDKLGRPSISTLPAPVRGSKFINGLDPCGTSLEPNDKTFFLYVNDFVKSNNTTYNFTNFDVYENNNGTWVDKLSNPADPLDTDKPGTLGWYYSTNNNATYGDLASIEGAHLMVEEAVPVSYYPYSRAIYKTDGTNQVKASTLPGDYHHSATEHYVQSDQTTVDISDEPLIADYLALYNQVFPSITTSRALWKIFKSVAQDMAYTNASNVSVDGNKNISYIDSDGKLLVTLHEASNTRSFVFYDLLGRVVCRVSPKGVEQFKAGVPFSDIDKTKYEYNSRGQVVRIEEKDAGVTRYMYRKDGMIRYIQNQEQASAALPRFSYIHYDQAYRVVETGEFTPLVGTYIFGSTELKNTLDFDDTYINNCDLHTGGTKTEVSSVIYDEVLLPEQTFVSGGVSKITKDNGTASYFGYDDRGRLIWVQQDIPELGPKSINYKYATNGQLKEVAYQAGQVDEFYHHYQYDADARLAKVFSGKQVPVYDENNLNKISNETTFTLSAEYSYYLHGPLKKVDFGIEHKTYAYTIQGWLKSINGDRLTATTAPAFAMVLDYFSGDYASINGNTTGTTNADPVTNYNGLIKNQTWRSLKSSESLFMDETYAYQYQYDNRYQLNNATWGKVAGGQFQSQGNVFGEGQLTYDANGNINTLARYNATGVLTHDFTGANKFVYEGVTSQYPQGLSNKLSSVPSYASYSYNTIGQLATQSISGDTRAFSYTLMGLTKAITKNGEALVNFDYNPSGKQWKKEHYTKLADNSVVLAQKTLYVHDPSGNVLAIYTKDYSTDPNPLAVIQEYNVYGSERIGQYRLDAGILINTYEFKDHVGNVRALISRNSSTQQLDWIGFNDYYPFGLKQQGYNQDYSRYQYQGEYSEFDQNTAQNHFELRDYDPVVGRWTGIDPYRQYYSGYVGMGNNPVSGIDPDGAYSYLGAVWRNWAFGEGYDLTKSDKPGEGWGYTTSANSGNVVSVAHHYKDPEWAGGDHRRFGYDFELNITIGGRYAGLFGDINIGSLNLLKISDNDMIKGIEVSSLNKPEFTAGVGVNTPTEGVYYQYSMEKGGKNAQHEIGGDIRGVSGTTNSSTGSKLGLGISRRSLGAIIVIEGGGFIGWYSK